VRPPDNTTTHLEQPVDFEFMTPIDWLEFHCELYDVVTELQLAVSRIDPGVVRLSNGRSVGLLQLAQHCHLRDRAEWRGLIGQHLRTVTAHLGDATDPISMIDLRIRLVPDTPADAATFQSFGARPFAEGVLQLLGVDVANAVRSVPVREVEELGWDVEEAWASAQLQTDMLERPDELHVIDLGGASFVHVFGERPFTASMVGIVDQLVEEKAVVGPDGAIVSMPSRHSVLVHPVVGRETHDGIGGLIPITRQLYRQGPASVSPHLYWWQAGQLTWLPTYCEGGPDGFDVESFPPPQLSAIIDR